MKLIAQSLDHVCEILTEKLKSTAELQLSKQQLITLTRESEKGEEISNNNHINEEGKDHEPKKIVHISQQIVRQSDPKIRELEDRVIKSKLVDFLVRENGILDP